MYLLPNRPENGEFRNKDGTPYDVSSFSIPNGLDLEC